MLALCLLAVGCQPGTIITAVPCAKHWPSPASTSLGGREPRRGARSSKVGKPSNQQGGQICPKTSN